MAQDKKITVDDVSRGIDKGINTADQQRVAALERLQFVRKAKATSLQKEQARLTIKYGADHPRVQALATRVVLNQGLLGNLVAETTRAKTDIPSVDEHTWVLHGYVRDKRLTGIPNLIVALYDDKGQWIQELGYGRTDKSGYFKMLHSRAKAGETNVGKEGEAPKTAPGEKVYIHITNSQGAHIYVDKQPLTPEPGRVDYREIIVGDDEAVFRPPESGPAPQPGKDEGKERTRYLGNSGKRELHDLENTKPRCQIDEIRPDHRVYFKTQREAQAAGYDYCAYCFGKEKSKR